MSGKDKLKKFRENQGFTCLVQPENSELVGNSYQKDFYLKDYKYKGCWSREFFGNSNPIVLEIGCGKGEYTLELARRCPSVNFIGIDIKGARLWRGAKTATEEGIANAAFIRTRIEFIEALFAPGEVQEIWITFADPQIGRERHRLTSPRFLERFRNILHGDGVVKLKTDSKYLYHYTLELLKLNSLPVHVLCEDVYAQPPVVYVSVADDHSAESVCAQNSMVAGRSSDAEAVPAVETVSNDGLDDIITSVQTFYEKHYIKNGLKIHYLEFSLWPAAESVDRETVSVENIVPAATGPYVEISANKLVPDAVDELSELERRQGFVAIESPQWDESYWEAIEMQGRAGVLNNKGCL